MEATEAIPDLQALAEMETDYQILAEIAAALAVIDPMRFAGGILSGLAVELYDPEGTGNAYSEWMLDPEWYPVSERIVFYNTGYMETLDLDEHPDVYKYEAEKGILHLLRLDDGKEVTIGFEIEKSNLVSSEFRSRPYFKLSLDTDPLSLNSDAPIESLAPATFNFYSARQ